MSAAGINLDNPPVPARGRAGCATWPQGTEHSRCATVWCLLWGSVLLLLTGPAIALPPGGAGERQGEILARVNGEPVTRADLQQLLADPGTHWQLREELAEAAAADGLYSLALHKLIQRRLFLQQAERQGVEVTAAELDRAIAALRARFPDLGSFGVWMKERGLDEQTLFDRLREDLVVMRVIASLVAAVEVSAQQVQDYYDTRREDLQSGEEVRLRIIVVKSRDAANEILMALRSGESFGRLARQRSLGQRAALGGDTGWVDTRGLAPSLRDTVALLRSGEASHPLQRNTDEYLVVALQGRRPLPAASFEAARPLLEQRLLAAGQREAVEAWLRRQEATSTIEWLVRQDNAEPADAASPEG